MIFLDVCVGSSCHITGSAEIVELLKKEIADRHLEDDIILSGCFCLGKCNRVGVSVKVGDEVVVGVTRDNFKEFFETKVMTALKNSEV